MGNFRNYRIDFTRMPGALAVALCVISFFVSTGASSAKEVVAQTKPETKYLLFQVFVARFETTYFPPQGQLLATVNDVIRNIGKTGDKHQKLGFVVGPLAFNQSDEETIRLIRESFKVANEKNVAIAFHIDDHIFWDARRDLFDDKSNREWRDWNGTLCTGSRLDWGPKPSRAPAQMCFNSPAIKTAIETRARLIGSEINRQLQALKGAGKEELFAGVIAGWETQILRDFETNHYTGYNALSNRGISAANSSNECDAGLVRIVKEHMETWASNLAQAGVPSEKIYAHIAFTPQGFTTPDGISYAQQVGFATPEVAFSRHYRPGFSTYPTENAIEQIRAEVAKRGNPAWISAEGTNVVPNGMTGEATMETYLGKMFNHGAVMVNIFSWGMGGEAERDNFFRRATEGDEALSAYRKFLTGKILTEQPRSMTAFSPTRLRQKIQAIQAQLPAWVERTRRPDIVQPLMSKLEGYIKTDNFENADRQADEILKVISAQ